MNREHMELLAPLTKFRKNKIDPHVEEDDKAENFRLDLYQELGTLGFCGMVISEKYEGLGLDYQVFCEVLKELSKSSVSYAVTISVSTMVQAMIEKYGNEVQKNIFLPGLTSGTEIAAFALSEAGSGSDAAALKTSATKKVGGYVLNGNKMWITSGGVAETYLVMARTGEAGPKGISAFLVKKGTAGFSFGKKESKMGWKVSPTRELIFDQCFVPEENLLGTLGQGFTIAMDALDRGRITIGAIAAGLSSRAIEEALKYSLLRKQFEQNIFDFQGIQFMLADMETESQASWLVVKEAARLYDEKKPFQKFACMAKLKATDVAMKVSTDAVQILGGVGYTTEYPVERLMRDAKVLQIVEGTNQIQKIVIARNLKKEIQG
jgi:alkylation response protein AidB-like acyl-CoA dehydrogenase